MKRFALVLSCVLFLGLFSLLGFLASFNPKTTLAYSTVFYDREGALLRLTLASDGQYRLPIAFHDIPPDAVRALMLYEDRLFYLHDGVDPVAFVRAFLSLSPSKRVVGGSTLSMQTARLYFKLKTRTLQGKFLQVLFAKYLELFYTKEEILELYFTLAPYGHNISGIEAASLVYFHKPAKDLTLPEILHLTLIPQNPGQRRPTTSEGLSRLEAIKPVFDPYFDSARNLPVSFYGLSDLPFSAPHLTTEFLKRDREGTINLTIDLALQKGIEHQLSSYLESVYAKGVRNGAVLVADFRTMEVLALVGSADYFNDAISGQVNGTFALRSPGSALKPFIYALGIEQGLIHPHSMLKDLPKTYGVYTPENYDRSFTGVLTAKDALMQSRNVPAVDLLLALKTGSYYGFLNEAGITHLKPEGFYGLALALGGFELSMAQTAELFGGLANFGAFRPLSYEINDMALPVPAKRLFSKEAGFLTLSMLKQNPSAVSVPVYYKTGTSFGFKDAWTAGIVGPYVVVVWFGNFDGESNPAFSGRGLAAPFFRQVARFISDFKRPLTDFVSDQTGLNLVSVDVCRPTGDLAGPYCPSLTKGLFIPLVSPAKVSTVHRAIPIVKKTGLRACIHDPKRTEMKVYEFWPSDVLQIFAAAGFKRTPIPLFEKDCDPTDFMAMPPNLLSPLRLDYYVSEDDAIPFKATTDASATKLFWFLDDRFIGESKPSETFLFKVPAGTYTVSVSDDLGRASFGTLRVFVKESGF